MTTGRINQVTTLADRAFRPTHPSLDGVCRSVASSATDRTRSPCSSRVVHLALFTEPSVADKTKRASVVRGRTKRAIRYFLAPSEHSLRGRNTQDCRVRNERTRARIYRSGLLQTTDDRACRTRTGRASLGRALAIAPMRENSRRSTNDVTRTFRAFVCRRLSSQ
jgi:hypothetical protein